MPPRVYEDTAAPLGTVGDGQAIDARRVALEVAGERIGDRIGPGTTPAIAAREQKGAKRHLALGRNRAGDIRPGSENFNASGETHSFREDRDSSSFVCSHQRSEERRVGKEFRTRG